MDEGWPPNPGGAVHVAHPVTSPAVPELQFRHKTKGTFGLMPHRYKLPSTELTERQKEILELVKAGKTSLQIAAVLGLSFNTVHRHRENIRDKQRSSASSGNPQRAETPVQRETEHNRKLSSGWELVDQIKFACDAFNAASRYERCERLRDIGLFPLLDRIDA